MRTHLRTSATVAGVVATLLVAAACTSKSAVPGGASSGSSGSGSSAAASSAAGQTDGLAAENINAEGTPVKGGTLHMLGVGDVDFMDPNISYYSGGYLALRLWSRQLVTYPAIAGKATTDVPDLATQLPTMDNGGISKDGTTYKFTIRKGAMWNTTPARQVTAADMVRGVKRTCNPAQPFGGMPDFQTLIVGLDDYCTAYAKVDAKSASAMADYQNSHEIAGVSVDPADPQTVVFKLVHPAAYFIAMLSLPAFTPSPKEYDAYVPASAELAAHTISDGP
ncbi:MAG: peptide/nickel transport system substrate-binding protein, partial [Actinomycetota bacterium]|nr:peptide/nickel transport system substrate-binding protein [Actinomycetota bacterium]